MSVKGLTEKEYKEVSADLTWQAVYPDRVINQYNEDGTQNSYDGLDRNGMAAFCLVNGKGETVLTVPLSSTQKLFYRMRVALFVGSHTRERVYIVGWQTRSARHIWVVDSHGKVTSYENFEEKSQWLYSPQFRLCEMPEKRERASPPTAHPV